VAHDATGNEKEAFGAFKKAFDLNSKDQASGRSAAYAAISVARRSRANAEKIRYYGEAGRLAERLVAVAPTFEHNLLAGEAWLGAKEYEKALSWFEKAKAKQPQNALVYFYRGQCYSSTKKYNSAVSELQEALKIGASGKLRTQIYNQMGYVYDNQGEYEKAGDAYGEAGNRTKVAEMREKKEQADQNRQASAEEAEFRRKVRALRVQIQELEKLGESEELRQLRDQLTELEKTLASLD
jgi:tetratricopeptide (TPR) repeat protein